MKTAIFITDIHYPYHDQTTIDICNKVCKELKPDFLIFGGDNWDANGVSKFTAKDTEEGLIDTYNEMIGFKEKIFSLLSQHAKETRLLLGNHDGQRLKDYLQRMKDKGNNNVFNYWNKQFDYKKVFGCKIYEYNEICKIGKLNFIHGERHNKYHANSHFEILMGNVMYGHMHSTQIFTKIIKGNEPFQSISIPCASELNPTYQKNRANAWLHGFGVVYFLDSGEFFYHIVQIIKGKTVFNGKEYK